MHKALRIMIAAEQHAQRLSIERNLNGLGYYRIAPVHSVEEVILLAHPPIDYFDLLIITDSMCAAEGMNLIYNHHGDLKVRNVLVVPSGVMPAASSLSEPWEDRIRHKNVYG